MFIDNDDDAANKAQNIQVIPSKVYEIPAEKVTEIIFDCTKADKAEIYTDENGREKACYDVVESTCPRLITKLEISPPCKLDRFDKAVFNAVISEQRRGNDYVALGTIYKTLGGSSTHSVPADMAGKILQSLTKMRSTEVTIDFSEIAENLYQGRAEKFNVADSLLPCRIFSAKINGQIAAVVQLYNFSPLVLLAFNVKKQFEQVNKTLLAAPMKATETSIKIKTYLLEGIRQVKRSFKNDKGQKLPKKILLDTLYAKCEVDGANKWRTQDIRNIIKGILDHFKAQGEISEWTFEKDGRKFRAITFDWQG